MMNSNQTSPRQMTEEQLWEIDRYLLNDPTLDREAFEQRMLEDESLSVAVASAVERLSMLSVAAEPVLGSMRARGASVTSVPRDSWQHRGMVWALLSAAAGLLIGLAVWQSKVASQEELMAEIAANWIAIENVSRADVAEPPSLTNEFVQIAERADASSADAAELAVSDQSDWLVEAAREFYLTNSEGAAL